MSSSCESVILMNELPFSHASPSWWGGQRRRKKPRHGRQTPRHSDLPKSPFSVEPARSTNMYVSEAKDSKTKPNDGAVKPLKSRYVKPHLRTSTSAPRPPKRNLLDLPGEIRNMIYEFLVPEARVLIVGNHPNKELEDAQQAWANQGQQLRRPRYRLYCQVDGMFELEEALGISMSLLLTCKQLRKEAEFFVYSRLSFCFQNFSTVNKFLNVVPKRGIEAIHGIEIQIHGYEQPRRVDDEICKNQYDISWQRTCERIGTEMIKLTSFVLHAHTKNWPTVWAKGARWHGTLLSLAEKRELHHVGIDISEVNGVNEKMWKVANRLERTMMTKAGLEARELKQMLAMIKAFEEREAEERVRQAKAKLSPVQVRGGVMDLTNPAIMNSSTGLAATAAKKPTKNAEKWQQGVQTASNAVNH